MGWPSTVLIQARTNVWRCPGAHPNLLFIGYRGSFLGLKHPVKVTTHFHLEQKLRMSGSVPLLALHAFMAWRSDSSLGRFSPIKGTSYQLNLRHIWSQGLYRWYWRRLKRHTPAGIRISGRPERSLIAVLTMLLSQLATSARITTYNKMYLYASYRRNM